MANNQPNETPEELLHKSVRGDRKSQEKLYRQFYGFAMGVCMRYTQSRDEALEIVNDGFLKIFTKGDQYNSKFPFKAWFRRIIVNTALDFYRSQQKHYFHENLEEAYEVSSNDSSPLSQLNHEEIIELVKRLPSGYRVVFNLYVIDGFSHEEISNQLGISVGTSKSNLSRAREALRKMILIEERALPSSNFKTN
ncbi:RNA polymerase, sigma-24 subunit, ECF subfamily [Emticicia oligotrophica DSM 17448]|uniref:RNA polymerase, sigma-24 subunit, ECF subfamily n=1 Tax=Emticicia oligotrophica (strain DSM 17448 / CIP 109782 / MTCC 6937 / GPTSA100-15) TaxID=929562 RepID=A0ABM5N203_EMTOG|nr:RNA polymerase sigma factor [Emticicia oligotrophica]AFK03496.1 RNA polymerase, sigma-24 subunit, ECF subfamily [Emticicia oligotrophica DSM 17448]